jgi:DNA-binding NarL/FixJ family response regulator
MNTGGLLYPAATAKANRRGQVLLGIWEGKGMKEIGAELGISAKTAEYHRAALYRVFGVCDAISLCRRALGLGLIKAPGVQATIKAKTQRSKDAKRFNRR